MEEAGQVGRSHDSGIPQSASSAWLDPSRPVGGEAYRGREVATVSNAGWRSTVSRIPKVLRGNTGGLFGAVLAVASSLLWFWGWRRSPRRMQRPTERTQSAAPRNPAWWHRTRPSIVTLRSTWL